MSKIANKQMICEVLMEEAKTEKILLPYVVIPEEVVLLLRLRIHILNSLLKLVLLNRI